MGDQQQNPQALAEEEGDGDRARGASKRRRNSKVKNMGRSRNLLHHADTPSGSSKDSPSAFKERKRLPTRERWLLTRKTWRYMADAGRRLIPDGAHNRAEDVPKIEAYFQRVCSREPRFLLWRKSSYPGALGFRSRKHRRGKKGGSCREKASSADEAEPGQPVDLVALKKDFTHRQKSILEGYGKGHLPDVPETVVAEDEEENERELLDSLSKFLSGQREVTEEHEHQTTSISTASTTGTGAIKKVQKEASVTENARDSSSYHNGKSGFSSGGVDYQKLVEQLQRYLSSNPQESQDNVEQASKREDKDPSDTRLLRRSTSATQRPLTTTVPYTTASGSFEGDHQQRDILETLRRYYSRSTCRQKVITDLLTDRKLLERLYFDLRKTRGFKPSNRGGSQFVPGLRSYSREETSSFNLRRGNAAGSDMDVDESRYKSQEAAGKQPRAPSPFSPPPLIEIQHEPLWRDRAVQTEPIPASILVAVEDELRRVRQAKEEDPTVEKVVPHTSSSPRRRSSVDNDDVSPSVSDTIKRYLRMARKKSIDADKTDRFKRVNYDRNLRNIKAKPDTMGNLISEDDDVNKGCQPDESWIAALKELKLEDSILLLSPSSDQDVSPESHMSSRSSLDGGCGGGMGGAISDDNLLSPPSAGHSQTCTTAGAMQKSKSSSSVVHHGSRLVAKKIWRSRSKSQSRSVPCTWTPQGNCCWSNMAGRTVTLNDTSLMSLTEVERRVLQKVALAKLQALNLGVTIRIPSESVTTVSGHKPKRRAYLLKRKALTTGFFDTARSKEEKEKDGTVSSPGGGLVFGIPISQCLENDRVAAERQAGHSPSRLEDTAPGASALRRKSHHGSRSSFTSLIETSTSSGGGRAGEESGSCESLMSPGIAGSVPGLLDSLSCGSTTDIASAATEHEPNIPQIVNSCFRHLENYGLHTLGIFRVSTSKKRVRQLREEFDCGKDIVLGEDHCPHDVATLLKEFFRDLPEPLLCRDLYQAFVHTQRIRNRRLQLEALQHLIQLLPVPNRDTLWALLNFLANVARNATDHKDESGEWVEGSKMDSNNLATVFAPNILHCIKPGSNKEMSIERAEERIDVINVIRTMIDHNRQLFQVPAELLDEVYIHMMDSHPEVLDSLLRKRGNLNDEVLDDPESSVTEGGGSEPSSAPRTPTQEHLDNDEPGTVRRVWSREEFLHESAGMGGPDVSMRPRYKDKDRGRERGSKKRWRDEPNARRRTSELETGSERTGFSITTSASTSQISSRQRTYQQVGGMESVDVVKVRSVSVDGGSTTMVQHSGNSRLAASEDNEAMRRQSVPLPDGSRNSTTGGGVITASLKIPVSGASTSFALNLDDADIPYIEDAGGGYSISSESGRQQMTIGLLRRMGTGDTGISSSSSSSNVTTAMRQRRQRSVSGSDSSQASAILQSPSSFHQQQNPPQGSDSALGSTTMSSPPRNTGTPSMCSSDAGLYSSTPSWASSPPTSPDGLGPPQIGFSEDLLQTTRISIGTKGSTSTQQQRQQQRGTKEIPIMLQKVTFTSTSELQQVQRSQSTDSAAVVTPQQSRSSQKELPKSASSSAVHRQAEVPAVTKTTTVGTDKKLTTSISSIGGAVMRSKTADIERMLRIKGGPAAPREKSPTAIKTKTTTAPAAQQQSTVTTATAQTQEDKKKYAKRRYTDSRHQTRHIPDSETLQQEGGGSASHISSSSSVTVTVTSRQRRSQQQQGAVWKRRELIASDPKDHESSFL